jgi:hypothetical protein
MRLALAVTGCLLTILCAVPGSGWAVPVTWTLRDVVFNDGGVATGTFVYDADTNTYSSVNVTTTTGTARAGATYAFVCTPPCVDGSQPSSTGASFLTTSPASDLTGLPVFVFASFDGPLTNAGARGLTILVIELSCADATCIDPEQPSRVSQGVITTHPEPIPTLSEWGTVLLVLSLLALGTWQLAGRPALLHVATAGGLVPRAPSHRLLDFVLVGQIVAGVGLGLYGWLIKPLAPQDLIGAILAGAVLGVLLECYRRGRER